MTAPDDQIDERTDSVPLALIISAMRGVMKQTRAVVPDVRGDTRLASLDLESLELVELFVIIEDSTGLVAIAVSVLEAETVADLAAMRWITPA